MEEHGPGTGQILGDDGIEESRGDPTLDDDAAEPAATRRLLVVVERVAVAGHGGEPVDVGGFDDPCPSGPVSQVWHGPKR